MEVPKLIILLWSVYSTYASHYSHTIPVEGYETKLQDLGQHVDHHDTPVRVIKITKTIAVKVPVPYPVKVIEKVPYPVHVAKPYPVPVPQIVKVPHSHDAGNVASEGSHHEPYQVHEDDSSGSRYTFGSNPGNSYNGGFSVHGSNKESLGEHFPSDEGSSHEGISHSYYGISGVPALSADESFESKSYDQAIQAYLSKNRPNDGYSGSAYEHNTH